MGGSFAIVGSRGYPSTYGGFETFVRRFAPYLAEHGDDVTVYCRDGHGAPLMRDGVRCVSTRGIESNSLSTLSHGLTAALHARKQKYDAALVLNVANGYYLPILQRAGIPTAVNVDGIEWQRAKWGPAGKRVFRGGATMTAKYATEIVVDSKEIGRIWRTELGRDGVYIPYGADVVTDVADDRIMSLDIKPGSYALVVARLVPENNIDLFLDALDRLDPSLPAVVVGSASAASPIASRLQARAVHHPSFRWLGHVADQVLLGQLWSHCAVYFHGHSAGGTNPGLLQALGHGAPALAVDTPFNAEVLGSPDQLVFQDARAVATRMRAILDDSTLRERLGRHGRSVISDRYSWDGVLGRYRDLLISLARQNG